MANYNPQRIEKKWQDKWEKLGIFQARDKLKKAKFYVLVEFPYPSGEGLHVGHCRSYIAMDVLARKRRMEGFNVLFPIGWDAFGLPTENYAIKTGVAPSLATQKNTDNFRRQAKRLGLSFDWKREINTTDPNYYKWTQWIFLQLFKEGLAYKKKLPVNWCPSCKIVLANEEVINGACERCGAKVTKIEKEQWLLRITKYADRLSDDLAKVDYPGKIKILQKDWIGRSEGAEIEFPIKGSQEKIKVFTTRPDTLFGATYLVLAPEHELISKLSFTNINEIKTYIEKAKNKKEIERIALKKDKTGVELKGVKAINPATKGEIPVWVADYVLSHYGEGSIMSVPAHDERDFQFAKKYGLIIESVVIPSHKGVPREFIDYKKKETVEYWRNRIKLNGPVLIGGIVFNSGKFTGMPSEKAKWEITKFVGGKRKTQYRFRDWIFSRQRYWGEPIPLIFCEKCSWVPVLEKDLPVRLPEIKDYKPTEKGESPLAKVKNWVNVKCPSCRGQAKRETDVMPNWAGSNWYYLRYCDPKNNRKLADPKKIKYWLPVDWYNGGMEHVTLHLLYSRFIFKFLWDIGAIPKNLGSEPYKKRTAHGVILGGDGVKMSKSRGNIINPDKIVEQHSTDAMRLYTMFMGPFGEMIPWDMKGLIGARRFLEKVWRLGNQASNAKGNSLRLKKILHKAIKKVSEDIEVLKFNTAISTLMEFSNTWQQTPLDLSKEDLKDFLKILSPFAPHLTEELWEKSGFTGFCCQQKWPKADLKLIREEKINLIIQINGKVRDKIEINPGISQKEAENAVLKRERVKKWLAGKKIKKIIFVPEKLINIVV
ncbi:MAG: leucine--tRNA ligase [Patescibacteria group bacterium]